MAGLVVVAGVAFAVFASDESTADGPLVCPNDDKVAGHGFPNPANPSDHPTPEAAVRAGLEELANLEVGVVKSTGDPTFFLAEAPDTDTVIAAARVVEVGDLWRLDQFEVCGYPEFTPATGPPTTEADEGSGRSGRRKVAA